MLPLSIIGINMVQEYTIPEVHKALHYDQIALILTDVHDHWLKYYNVKQYFPIEELLLLDWSWVDTSNKTLPARISKILKQHGAILPKSLLGSLGNHAKESIPQDSDYIFDITQTYNWTAGTFNDHGSCMWTNRRKVREKMQEDKRFHCFRLYSWDSRDEDAGGYAPMLTPVGRRNDKVYYGLARMWLFQDTIKIRTGKKIKNHHVCITWNGYGKTLKQQTAILASKLGCAVKSIKLSNKKKAHGGLYFNGPGYILGDAKVIQRIDHFDFSLDNCFDDGNPLEVAEQPMDRVRERTLSHYYDKMKAYKKLNRKWTDPKLTNRQKKRPDRNAPTGQIIREAHYRNRNLIYDMIHYHGSAKWDTQNVQTLRFYWKYHYKVLSGNFFSCLVKIIQHKINRGNNEKANGSKEPKKQHSQSSLRGNEGMRTTFSATTGPEIRVRGV